LRKKYRPKMFEDRVLRGKELDVRREQVIGGWRKLRMRSFVFCAPHQIFFRRPSQGDGIRKSCIGEKRVTHKVSVGKHQGRRPLERLGSTCKNSCEMDLREIGCVRVAAYGNTAAIWNTVMNPRVPKVRGVCLLGEEPFASVVELCPVELVAFKLSGYDLELDIGLAKCNSILFSHFDFHFDLS
jgi:hypothetical protein